MTDSPLRESEDLVVDEVTSADPGVLKALGELIPQLSSSAPAFSQSDLEFIATSPATILLVARRPGGEIVGSLTLVVFRAPTGPRAWIEDVVVSEKDRGGGIGSLLVEHALERAKGEGARTVDLTSRPSREAANRLYVRLGFKQRETNVYRYEL